MMVSDTSPNGILCVLALAATLGVGCEDFETADAGEHDAAVIADSGGPDVGVGDAGFADAATAADAGFADAPAVADAADPPDASDAGGVTTLVDCTQPGEDPDGGDLISRGFYVAPYPGVSLSKVVLAFGSNYSGTYQLRLTARAGAYDGSVIGVAEAGAALSDTDVPVEFDFADEPVVAGSTVTFVMEKVSGPGGALYFAVSPLGGGPCPVTETVGTVPPLDSWRRDGVWVRILGLP